MTRLLLTRGLPASGKSTWARAWVREDRGLRSRINRDEMRIALGIKHGENEALVTEVQQAAVRACLAGGRDVVVDDTNLNARFAKEWLKIARRFGIEVEWHDEFLDVPVQVCIDRDQDREATVGYDVIMSMYQRYLRGGKPKRPVIEESDLSVFAPYEGTPGKPKAFLVDLDGTIALNGPDRDHPSRGYFDWHRVGEDLPATVIIDIVHHFERQGLKPVFVSGREDVCENETINWIIDHVYDGLLPYTPIKLLMRKEGDKRADDTVKLEIFDGHIRDHYDVQFAIDDRDRVVRAYRNTLGLTVLQVAEGDF